MITIHTTVHVTSPWFITPLRIWAFHYLQFYNYKSKLTGSHISAVLPSSSPPPAKGPEESSVCVQQTMLRYWWSSLPDHRQCSGLLPPDLPAGCGSGDWQEIHRQITLFGLICCTRKTHFSLLKSLQDYLKWPIKCPLYSLLGYKLQTHSLIFAFFQ